MKIFQLLKQSRNRWVVISETAVEGTLTKCSDPFYYKFCYGSEEDRKTVDLFILELNEKEVEQQLNEKLNK